MSFCIIGAGMAGLNCAKHALKTRSQFTVFEQNDHVGGTWMYTNDVGKNKFSLDVHSSMYSGLRTNLPKEIMGFPDCDIKGYANSYIPSNGILNFLECYAREFKLLDHIKFLHYVVRIIPKNNNWQVIVKNLKKNKMDVYTFKYVFICTGHYHTPMMPKFQNLDSFNGNILHSHNFREKEIFRDQTVLIIGAGPSGMDLCHEISKIALRVIFSHHLSKHNTKFLKNVTEKPDVLKFDKSGAFFSDGSYESLTCVIFCTGYKFAFPFLSVDCGIFVDDNYIQPLFKHCININYPKMHFVGLPFYVCAAHMMDLQVRFIEKFIFGEKHLPSKKEMLLTTENEMKIRWAKGFKFHQAHMMGTEQDTYYIDLANLADVDHIKPVMAKLHNESSYRFNDDLLSFRKDCFRIIDNDNFVQI